MFPLPKKKKNFSRETNKRDIDTTLKQQYKITGTKKKSTHNIFFGDSLLRIPIYVVAIQYSFRSCNRFDLLTQLPPGHSLARDLTRKMFSCNVKKNILRCKKKSSKGRVTLASRGRVREGTPFIEEGMLLRQGVCSSIVSIVTLVEGPLQQKPGLDYLRQGLVKTLIDRGGFKHRPGRRHL